MCSFCNATHGRGNRIAALAPAVPGRAPLAARLEISQKASALREARVSAGAKEPGMIMLITK